jgi:hypothetical protein
VCVCVYNNMYMCIKQRMKQGMNEVSRLQGRHQGLGCSP